jgi:glutamate 5-kinase
LPVINENDTTSTDEIKFGDNDKLSALTAVLLEVDLLVLATNTFGVYDNNKNTIKKIDDIQDVYQFIDNSFSNQGTGGMKSKLAAAKIAQENNIESWIVNGHENSFLLNAISEKSEFSRIL